MVITYFSPSPTTCEELKKTYRLLAMQYHPDRGGDLEIMKRINAEYDVLFPKLKDIHKNKDGVKYTSSQASAETPDQFKDLISKLIMINGITVEIIGCFVWVTGDTMKHREALKLMNFQWHSSKKAWYLKPENYFRRSRKNYSLDTIRSMYGSIQVTADDSGSTSGTVTAIA